MNSGIIILLENCGNKKFLCSYFSDYKSSSDQQLGCTSTYQDSNCQFTLNVTKDLSFGNYIYLTQVAKALTIHPERKWRSSSQLSISMQNFAMSENQLFILVPCFDIENSFKVEEGQIVQLLNIKTQHKLCSQNSHPKDFDNHNQVFGQAEDNEFSQWRIKVHPINKSQILIPDHPLVSIEFDKIYIKSCFKGHYLKELELTTEMEFQSAYKIITKAKRLTKNEQFQLLHLKSNCVLTFNNHLQYQDDVLFPEWQFIPINGLHYEQPLLIRHTPTGQYLSDQIKLVQSLDNTCYWFILKNLS